MTFATEYFVSYYDCPRFLDDCDKAVVAGHKCSERPDNCPNWQLRYRCRLGNMTERELTDFKQSSDIDNLHDYRLQSVNGLSLESREKKTEHKRARKDFESITEWDHWSSEIQTMRIFEGTAESIVRERFGAVFIPHFVDNEIASIFYGMERAIIEEVIDHRIQALDSEKGKLCEGKMEESDLTDENRTRLAVIGDIKNRLRLSLEKKRQELRKLQEVGFTLITSPTIIDESLTQPTPADNNDTQVALENKKELYIKEQFDIGGSASDDTSNKTVNKGGRPRSKKSEWIIKQFGVGLTPAQILDKWDEMSDELRKSIDNEKHQRFVSVKLIDEDKRAETRKRARDLIEKLRPKQNDS